MSSMTASTKAEGENTGQSEAGLSIIRYVAMEQTSGVSGSVSCLSPVACTSESCLLLYLVNSTSSFEEKISL